MAAGQGMKRIDRGIVRPFTKYECERGYIYLSRDRELSSLLTVEDFTVVLGDARFEHRKIDKFGRFQLPRQLLREYGTEALFSFDFITRDELVLSMVESR